MYWKPWTSFFCVPGPWAQVSSNTVENVPRGNESTSIAMIKYAEPKQSRGVLIILTTPGVYRSLLSVGHSDRNIRQLIISQSQKNQEERMCVFTSLLHFYIVQGSKHGLAPTTQVSFKGGLCT